MASADPFPASDFDQWAATYDDDVDRYTAFPFAGYKRALEMVVQWAEPQAGMSVLDIGVGTGNLALRFAEIGCKLWCVDYSPLMLEKARLKLPTARFVLYDLREPWPPELDRRFDRIVSAYTIHHFELDRKVAMIVRWVRQHLAPDGNVTIADLSFASAEDMRSFAKSIGDQWDEEPYWIADEVLAALGRAGLSARYEQVPPCAGVYRIEAP